MKISQIDIKLINELINDSNQTDTQLGIKIGLSGVAIRNRIDKLVENEVIEKFVPQYQAEPFGMNSLYVVASEKNYRDIFKRVRIFGKPSFIMDCVGSTVMLGIIVKENFEEKIEFAQQLIEERKIITVSTSKSPGFNNIITKTELKILQALIPNTQVSNEELSQITNFSQKTISRALQRLRENNILHSTIIWNPKKIDNYLTFYVEISVTHKAEKITEQLTKDFSKSFLAKPMIFDNEICLTMFVNNIYEIDEIIEKIKKIKEIKRADAYIPKKFEFIYDWFNDLVKELESAPLHLSFRSQSNSISSKI